MSTMQALPIVNKISFKNILFLTDFTESSQGAMAYALGFANHFGAQVYPAHACDPIILTETAAPDILDEVEENSRRRLNDAGQRKQFQRHTAVRARTSGRSRPEMDCSSTEST